MSKVQLPIALNPPFSWNSGDCAQIWQGPSKLIFHDEVLEGVATVKLRMTEHPKWVFDFQPNVAIAEFASLKRNLMDPHSLKNAKLRTDSTLGDLDVDVSNFPNGTIVDCDESDNGMSKSLVYAIFNGLELHGMPLQRGTSSFCGRFEAILPNARITVDKALGLTPKDCTTSILTHIAHVQFDNAVDNKEVGVISELLFRTLSMMRLGWVGLAGPWYFGPDLIPTRIDCVTTKMSRSSGQLGWCQPQMDSSFGELLLCIHNSRIDKQKFDSMIMAMHYTIESEQCSGGIEGALILQQAALECLAWLEMVQTRSIYSNRQFKNINAHGRMRELLSLNNIAYSIPEKAEFLKNYPKNEEGILDLVQILSEFRNALVHSEPKHAVRLFAREHGDEERLELWHFVGMLVQQALLASFGYKGKMLRRDSTKQYAVHAVEQVPWVQGEA